MRVLAVLLLISNFPAVALAATHQEVAAELRRLAFDPANFFSAPSHPPGVTITHTGDDYAWPAHAIAIQMTGPNRSARLVRASGGSHERPRVRGLRLVQELIDRKVPTSDFGKALDRAGLQWLEANIDQCPGAAAVLARVQTLSWMPEDFTPTDDFPVIMVHADQVRVVFKGRYTEAVYAGYIAKGSPAAWSLDVVKVMEPCWKPAAAPPPWRPR